jgi:hypothetical protein
MSSVSFIDPPMDKKIQIIRRMEKLTEGTSLKIYLCCEKEVLETLDMESFETHTTVSANSCVDGKLLKKLFDGKPETRRDYGQRSKQGCRCSKSIDVGLYDEHPCFHNCLFCYANPEIDTQIKRNIKTNEN